MGVHVSLRVRAHPAPRRAGVGLSVVLHDLRPGRRRPAHRVHPPRLQPRLQAVPAPVGALVDQCGQERDGQRRGLPRPGPDTGGAQDRRRLRRVPGQAAQGRGHGFRRSAAGHGRALPEEPRCAGSLPAPVPPHPRRRVPGHQPGPERAGPPPGRRPPQRLRRRRPGPVPSQGHPGGDARRNPVHRRDRGRRHRPRNRGIGRPGPGDRDPCAAWHLRRPAHHGHDAWRPHHHRHAAPHRPGAYGTHRRSALRLLDVSGRPRLPRRSVPQRPLELPRAPRPRLPRAVRAGTSRQAVGVASVRLACRRLVLGVVVRRHIWPADHAVPRRRARPRHGRCGHRTALRQPRHPHRRQETAGRPRAASRPPAPRPAERRAASDPQPDDVLRPPPRRRRLPPRPMVLEPARRRRPSPRRGLPGSRREERRLAHRGLPQVVHRGTWARSFSGDCRRPRHSSPSRGRRHDLRVHPALAPARGDGGPRRTRRPPRRRRRRHHRHRRRPGWRGVRPRGRRHPHLRGRRDVGAQQHLRLSGCGHAEHRGVRDPLPGHHRGAARAELSQQPDHPRRGQRGHRQQPGTQAQGPVDRCRQRREDHPLPRGRRGGRGSVDRTRARPAARRRAVPLEGHGSLLPDQRPESSARGAPGPRRHPLQGHRRHPVLRPSRDQGRAGVPEGGGEPHRRGVDEAGRQHAQARGSATPASPSSTPGPRRRDSRSTRRCCGRPRPA